MNEPSDRVPPALLRHVHLVSSHQFPRLANPNLEAAVEYLIQAPSIVKEHAPMSWTFLDCPQDGTVMLVWQPSQLELHAASDGYVWVDAEQAFNSEMRGYSVEMYVHRSGFRLPHEAFTTHARRRYRLTPSQHPDPNLPPADQSLWLLHYTQAEPQNRFPRDRFQIPTQIRHQQNDRIQLQRQGQLIRKEFMLRDSASWPIVNFPNQGGLSHAQQPMGYPGDVISHMNRSQQQAYIHQQQANAAAAQRGIGPSPAKRPRHGAPNHAHPSSTAIPAPVLAQDKALEEEEGLGGGDFMDNLTPREISQHRYDQHHEWMDEILHSPYDTNRIIPGELGLGRKGELESLTRDFFDAPTDPTPREVFSYPETERLEAPMEADKTPRVGRLEAGKAEDFTQRASERIAKINAEIEKLKRQHARRMAKVSKGLAFKDAEEKLRASTIEMIHGEAGKSAAEQEADVKKLVSAIEARVGKSIKPLQDVECIEKGGLEDKSQGRNGTDQDFEMVDNFGNLEDTRVQEISSGETQKTPSTDQKTNDMPQGLTNNTTAPRTPGLADVKTNETAASSEAKDQAPEDWIMVNRAGSSTAEEQGLPDLDGFVNDAAMQPGTDDPDADNDLGNTGLPEFTESGDGGTAEDFEVNDFGEGIDFGDLDTAGDELSGFGEQMDDAGGEGQDANDNAFGDAFQITEASAAQEDQMSDT